MQGRDGTPLAKRKKVTPMKRAKMLKASRAAVCFPLPPTGRRHSAAWGRVFTLFLAALMMFVIPGQLPAQTKDSLSLVGAGSTVPLPLYIKWSQEFNRLHRGVEMQYQPLGTSEGLKLISGSKDELGKTDFSAGEVLL